MIDKIKAAEVFKNLDDRCIPIIAPPGLRGHATLRILCSHKEVWWDSSLMNYNNIPDIDSLSYPDDGIFIDFRTPDAPHNINFMSAHTIMITNRPLNRLKCFDVIKDYYANPKNILQSHTIFQAHYIEHIPVRPFIYLYSSNLAYTVKQRSVWFSRDYKEAGTEYYNKKTKNFMENPIKQPLAFNIDVYKLYSEDDLVFESEYQKIVNHFNFTSNIDRVRSFIKLYLDREKSITPNENN